MNCPPLVMQLDISRPASQGHIVLWLPVFLAWLFLAAILLALSPLIVLVAMAAFFFGWGRIVLFIPLVWGCLCALRGLEVDVEKKDRTLFISFR